MATTTNYGWTTPDDTALVKDGASAIRTLGSSVDTSVKALNPGTTAGDLDYYTAATTKARIAIGTNGQVLTSNGSVPSWATPSSGGMTLLSTTTLSGTTTISSINQSYTNLMVFIFGVTNSVGNAMFRVAPNGSTSISDIMGNSSSTALSTITAGYIQMNGGAGTYGQSLFTDSANSYVLTINNYSSTTARKPFSASGGYLNALSVRVASFVNGLINTTSAISSLVFDTSANSLNGGTVLIYGVK